MNTSRSVEIPHLRGVATVTRVIKDARAFQRRRHDLKKAAFEQINKVQIARNIEITMENRMNPDKPQKPLVPMLVEKSNIIWIDGMLHTVTERDLLNRVTEIVHVKGVPPVKLGRSRK